jgi:hypothetical protein
VLECVAGTMRVLLACHPEESAIPHWRTTKDLGSSYANLALELPEGTAEVLRGVYPERNERAHHDRERGEVLCG